MLRGERSSVRVETRREKGNRKIYIDLEEDSKEREAASRVE